jgi:prepilin-type N-terminal cleavage/methylation domain-containing protein
MKKSSRGFSIIELMVVLVITGIVATLIVSRMNLYEARHGGRSAAQMLQADMRTQRQKAFTLETTAGIDVAPGGDMRVYRLWMMTQEATPQRIITKITRFSDTFRSDVYFAPGMENRILTYYPWTSGTGPVDSPAPILNEWSVNKMDFGGVHDIYVIGGDIKFALCLTAGNTQKIIETTP